jgi:hypothetical protein
MQGYRDRKQFTTINHSKKAQNTGLSGEKVFYRNSSFKNRAKRGVIGVKGISQKLFIQKKHKTRDYRGIKQFTEINHSNRAKYGVIGVKGSLLKSIIQKRANIRGYRGIEQFTAIIHSKKAQNTG